MFGVIILEKKVKIKIVIDKIMMNNRKLEENHIIIQDPLNNLWKNYWNKICHKFRQSQKENIFILNLTLKLNYYD